MKKLYVIVYLLYFFFTGCKKDATHTAENANANITSVGVSVYPDTTGHIVAFINDTVVIKILNSAFDGGYTWNVTRNFDSTKVHLIKYNSHYTGSSGMVGAPTYQVWQYLVLKQGTDSLQLKLFRVFEPSDILCTKSYYLSVH